MFSTDFIFRQQENLVDNQKSQAGYRPLRNKILLLNRIRKELSYKSVFKKEYHENGPDRKGTKYTIVQYLLLL